MSRLARPPGRIDRATGMDPLQSDHALIRLASVELSFRGAWTTPRKVFRSAAEGIDQADRGVIEVAQVAGRQLSLAGEGDAGDQGVA